MVRRVFLVVVLSAVVAAAGACQSKTDPSGLLTGLWRGTVTENPRGLGAVELDLEQSGTLVDGRIKTTFGGVVDREGPVKGTAAGDRTTLTFTPSQPLNCGPVGSLSGTLTLTLTLTDGELNGSYVQFGCDGVISGVVNTVKD